MDITLNSETPTADATGLTEGSAYSIYHRGGITASVVIAGTHTQVYESPGSGPGFYLPKLPGTVIRFALAANTAADSITVI